MESWATELGEDVNFHDITPGRQFHSVPATIRRTRQSVGGQFPQLSPQSLSDTSKYKSVDEEETNMGGCVEGWYQACISR
jgi:hypothetical protein